MTKPYLISSADVLERFTYRYAAHHNKGYERDPATGKYYPDAAHLGYGWEYCCVECPRLRFIDYIMEPGQEAGSARRVWHVDGGRDDLSLPDALVALQKPPLLSLTAFYALLRMRISPRGTDAEALLLGCDDPQEKYGHSSPDNPRQIWSRIRDELTKTGYMENGELTNV